MTKPPLIFQMFLHIVETPLPPFHTYEKVEKDFSQKIATMSAPSAGIVVNNQNNKKKVFR